MLSADIYKQAFTSGNKFSDIYLGMIVGLFAFEPRLTQV